MSRTSLSIRSSSPNASCALPISWGARTSWPAPIADLRRAPSTGASIPPSCGRSSRRWSRARGLRAGSCGAEGGMRHIDAFCHFFPPALFARMSQTSGGTRDIGKRMQGVRTIYDLDARLKMMDAFDDYSEILSLGLPPIDAITGPEKSPELARIGNDGLAELCAKYPGRFAGYVGALPMNAPNEAAKEAERILIAGNANGLQLHTNVNGVC